MPAFGPCRGYVIHPLLDTAPSDEQIVGPKVNIFYDIMWTDGPERVLGRMDHVQPHGRPEGPDDMEIRSAGPQWQVWGNVGPEGLIWHCVEQETTEDCGSGGTQPPIPIPEP